MKIEIIELEKGFAVKFPFELKDNFRQTFKSAKWNSYEKRWEVGPRSKKRLEQWVEIASPLADDIEKADETELTEQEVIKLQEEIIEKRTEISRARASKETFLSTIEQLNKAKEELKKAQEELEEEKKQQKESAAKAKEIFSKACNLDDILSSQKEMAACHGKVGSANRETFNEAQSVIEREYTKLLKIGFRSIGLAELCYCNFNRPDRDRVDNITLDQILTLTEVEEDC